MIDAVNILDELGIDYKTTGKNVSTNDVNVDCPFCGADKHLTINKANGKVYCWVCNLDIGEDRKPSLLDILVESTDMSRAEVYGVMKEYMDDEYYEQDDERASILYLPKEARRLDTRSRNQEDIVALHYLYNRGIGKKKTAKYGLLVCHDGYFAGRIIIPVYFDGKLVNYLGRDYTGENDPRYKNCPNRFSVMRPKEVLYGWDRFKGRHLRLVEGAFDVFRIGDSSLGLIKGSMSREQRSLILSLSLDSMTVFLDKGNLKSAYTIAENLSPYIDRIKVVEMGDDDVADSKVADLADMERKARVLVF